MRTEKLDVMLTPAEKQQVARDAAAKELPVSTYVRRKLGLPVATRGRPPKTELKPTR
jgi:hypothetical protein